MKNKPPCFREGFPQAFKSSCRDLIPSSHNSISDVVHWCWATRPWPYCTLILMLSIQCGTIYKITILTPPHKCKPLYRDQTKSYCGICCLDLTPLHTTVSSQGELSYDGHEIRVFDFLTQRSTKHTARNNVPCRFGLSGHGGADYHLMDAFISAVAVSAHKYC